MLELNLLKTISSPGQYINSEFNSETLSIRPKWNNQETIKVCLCYPDKYVVGMCNLGIEILYKLLNHYDYILCERVYTPDVDMEKLLRDTNTKIFSLETQHKLTDFDIIGFSLQHELCYTNIFTVLSLAGIPFKRCERKKFFPLIIAGGPCSSNPYVLAEYIDFFILGEAEETLLEVINIIAKYKKKLLRTENKNSVNKQQLLYELNKINSVFVPEFPDKKVFPSVVDIKKSFYPETPTVPLIRTSHLRLNIELTRGCAFNCNFCQAGYIHKPLRCRDKEHVLYLLEKGLLSTGYDEVAFTGFCVTNYPYLLDVIDFVNKKFENITISLPSLRIEDINESLLEKLSCSKRKTTITLAPETATERLRRVINKYISNHEIFQKIYMLYKYGFRKIKLYFMIGLPSETEQDVEFIPKFVKLLYKSLPGIRINLTVSIFVPKPHTPFEFLPMDSYEMLDKKLRFLSKQLRGILNIGLIDRKIYSSFIEALISRGDQQIGKLIEEVWYEGARFDNWKENFNPQLWLRKIHQLNIELDKYIFIDNKLDSKFVWDNIIYSISKENLYQRCCNSLQQQDVLVEELPQRLSFEKEDNKINKNFNILNKTETKNLFTLRLRFARRGKIKFISYLDQVEIIKRVLRMSFLPVCYTLGFNPQIKMSLGIPIPVGYESNSEYVDVELRDKVKIEDVIKIVNNHLPEGMSLMSAKIFSLPLNKISAISNIANVAEYIIKSQQPFSCEKLQEFLSLRSLIIEKRKNGKIKTINLREVVKHVELKDKNTLYLLQRFAPHKTVKVEDTVCHIFGIDSTYFYKFDILRENLYIETNNGSLLELI